MSKNVGLTPLPFVFVFSLVVSVKKFILVEWVSITAVRATTFIAVTSVAIIVVSSAIAVALVAATPSTVATLIVPVVIVIVPIAAEVLSIIIRPRAPCTQHYTKYRALAASMSANYC